jgi:Fe-S cluster assembly protein SufD
MSALISEASSYFNDFMAIDRAGEPLWLRQRRELAIRQFEARGFPGRKDEAWRNLRLSELTRQHLRAASGPGALPMQLAPLAAMLPEGCRKVLVDGHCSHGHRGLDRLPSGVRVRSLADVIANASDELEADLGHHADIADHPYAALNMAFVGDGVVVDVAADVQLEQPLLLVMLNSEGAAGQVSYPRVLIRTGIGAELTVVMLHAGPDGVGYVTCPVTEIRAGANSRVTLHHLEEEGDQAHHLGLLHADLQRDARLRLRAFSVGAAIARTDLVVNLNGPGASAELSGLYLATERRYTDYHTTVRHQHGDCTSTQLFKGVLDGRGESVFDGLIHVARDAQRTDARQENRNLLLSQRALAHSNPRLEIYADDVKCGHGSTVGQLDGDALFYLRSRGIGEQDARALLTYAFANEVLDAVDIEPLRAHQQARLLELLPGSVQVAALNEAAALLSLDAEAGA